jgi:hypothetical protein
MVMLILFKLYDSLNSKVFDQKLKQKSLLTKVCIYVMHEGYSESNLQ